MLTPQLLHLTAAVTAVIVALISLVRSRRTMADWLFATGLVVLTLETLASGLIASANNIAAVAWSHYWQALSGSFVPVIWTAFSLTYARGGFRQTLRRWWPVLLGLGAAPVLLAIFFGQSLNLQITPVGPDSARWVLNLGTAGIGLNLCQLIGAVIVLVNLERTFRAAVGTMRWRIKFTLLGLGLLFVVRLYTSSQMLLFHGVDPALDTLNSGALFLASLLALRSAFRTPQEGRTELEVYPSRSVLQGSLTVLLAGIYLLIVGAFAKFAVYLGGDRSFAFKAFIVLVAVVFLAVLLQSDRVRVMLRRFVSRNFQRDFHDYRSMWMKFTAATAACVEQADLSRSLVRLVADMFEALSVSLWLMDDRKENLGLAASTSLAPTAGSAGEERRLAAAELVRYFREHPEPVDFETAPGAWADSLRAAHPGVFPNGGHRVAVPLLGRGEVIGIMIVGDRVGGIPFSIQDFDMLKCVGDSASASLLNLQLGQRLLQAKELEAFQTMATFFVHDLKNAASTLNLMLKNLPVHFDDPAFREDALRGMGKTVTHINHLISRLSLLRHELKMSLVDTDLGELVNQSLTGLEAGPGLEIVKELAPLPKVPLDPEQIAKVIINLVLNAREALPAPGGTIRVTTSRRDGWVVVSVKDNGCGMSREFLAHSLFRPFQTTKKGGLGIGMFQSKMIVEAHGGQIKVESDSAHGTEFQVLLPATRA